MNVTRTFLGALAWLLLVSPMALGQNSYGPPEPQEVIPRIAQMPDLPQPLKILDWKHVTQQYDQSVFSLTAHGQYLPIVFLDTLHENFPWTGFGLPAYVGENCHPGGQQAISCLSAVLSATLAGIDKSKGPHNWVLMSEQFYNRKNGEDMVLNNPSGRTGASFWYEIWPNILFDGIACYYPKVQNTNQIMRSSADQWTRITTALTDAQGVANFDHTSFSLKSMKPVDNGRWKEPDAASGVSYLELLAYDRYGDAKYLKAADAAQKFLGKQLQNPMYELLEPYGAYAAARLNAEQGRNYDVVRQFTWAFGPSAARPSWGTIVGNWGGDDCDGLMGSITDCNGYAFTMNTFAAAGALVPLVRYDQRFAAAVGKWMLNAANAARLFYPSSLPPSHQSCPWWKGDPRHVIAYEGLRHDPKALSGAPPMLYASGDAVNAHWAATDFGIYGSSHVGLFGGIIAKTSDPAVLRLDCLKTDFFHHPAYPTYLYYNPHGSAVTVNIYVGASWSSLYDLVSHKFLNTHLRDDSRITIPAKSAVVVVVTPWGGRRHLVGHMLYINSIAVDFRADSGNTAKG